MSGVRLSGDLSSTSLVITLERRFGLLGYARLVKMLEQLAASETRTEGVVTMALSDWLEALQASADELFALLNFLGSLGWAAYHQEEPGSPIAVTFLQAEGLLLEEVPALPSMADQWAIWLQLELNMPSAVTSDPLNQQLFRRWCASNVTVTEMHAAVEAATKAVPPELSPTGLHKHLQAVRAERQAQAKRG